VSTFTCFDTRIVSVKELLEYVLSGTEILQCDYDIYKHLSYKHFLYIHCILDDRQEKKNEDLNASLNIPSNMN